MAISKTYVNNDFSILAQVLQSSGIFESVEYDDSNDRYLITCKISGGKTFLTFQRPTSGNYYTIIVYVNETDSVTLISSYSYGIVDAYTCGGGILMGGEYDAFIVTKTNNNVPCVVYNDTTTGKTSKTVAWGDQVPAQQFEYYPYKRDQSQIVPFSSNPPIGIASYTPDAGYMPITQFSTDSRSFGRIYDGSDEYITDGFWAVRDKK